MTDLSSPSPKRFSLGRIDKAWLALAVIILAVAIFGFDHLQPMLISAFSALGRTAPYIAFAVFAIAYLKATGAENLLGKAFEGREVYMILMAALLGGLSPFCSCQVIPFIAALLAVGAPLSAVMAFWLASPLMDPAMFSITAGGIGFDFAIAKTASAVGIGLLGGAGTMLLKNSAVFANPLREKPATGGCCSAKSPFSEKPHWRFWETAERRVVFRDNLVENGVFLLKWLLLAYTLEYLMVAFVPAEAIATVLGGDGLRPVVLGALVGAPAYLNGYAAVPLVAGLLEQGMAPGAAMSFVLAGGVSSIPAAIAVWALVKPRVFAAYLGYAFLGALIAGMTWQAIS
ncbi:permease [Rhodobacteraceae bacterium 63075]|nr:permease [Rhodobacteraceae bacterium 63075]